MGCRLTGFATQVAKREICVPDNFRHHFEKNAMPTGIWFSAGCGCTCTNHDSLLIGTEPSGWLPSGSGEGARDRGCSGAQIWPQSRSTDAPPRKRRPLQHGNRSANMGAGADAGGRSEKSPECPPRYSGQKGPRHRDAAQESTEFRGGYPCPIMQAATC